MQLQFTDAPWTLQYDSRFAHHPLIRCSDGLPPLALERSKEECEANVKLWHAAPSLYNALYNLATCVYALNPDDEPTREAYRMALEALALLQKGVANE